MKKIFYLLSSIVCCLCLFCACFKQNNNHVSNTKTAEYLSVSLPVSYFEYGTDVSISVSIGVPDTFISSEENIKQALLIISPDENFDLVNKNSDILSTITDFSPYIWEQSNNVIIYKFTKKYVIPQSIFIENSGEFYCMLLFFPADVKSYTVENLIFSMQYPILYQKDENGIALELVHKK
jgi:hypothetical protein